MRPAAPKISPLRSHWPLRQGMVFLNHGSFGACPFPVMEKQAELRLAMDEAPLQFMNRHHTPRIDAARNEVAPFVGADPANFVFVTNATSGVNAVVRSLDFQPGDEILITNRGYNACDNTIREVARRSGATIVVADVPFPLESDDQIVTAVLAAVTPRTRLAMLDHITSATALVFPIERLVRELEAHGVDTLVDGAHAPGILPLDLETLRPAYYTGNLHKWVCAPKGTAFLWVRPDKQDGLQPVVISHGNNTPRKGHSPFQDRFDWPGTQDTTGWSCAPEAIRWLGQCLPGGWDEVRTHNHELVVQGRNLICKRLGLTPPCPDSMLGSMSTLPMPEALATPQAKGEPDPAYARLFDEFGIELQVMPIDGRRWFRISAHLHNTLDEYRYLAEVLEKMAAGH